jgi:2'-5' RNA ligase
VTAGGRTALVVVTREAEPVVSPWRLRYLRATVERGIPAHVTILFPFVPAGAVGAELAARLRDLYAPVEPFRCDLASVDSFPGYAWLSPEPAARFLELIAITRRAFPELPPYGDPDLAPVPHCTIGADDDPTRLDEIVAELRAGLDPQLPIRCKVEAITLLEELDDETWIERESFPFVGRR